MLHGQLLLVIESIMNSCLKIFTAQSPSAAGCRSSWPAGRSGCGSSRKPANQLQLESSRLINLQCVNGICKITQFNKIQFKWIQHQLSGCNNRSQAFNTHSAQLVYMTKDIYIFAHCEANAFFQILVNVKVCQSLPNFSLFKFASLSFHRKLDFTTSLKTWSSAFLQIALKHEHHCQHQHQCIIIVIFFIAAIIITSCPLMLHT